MKRKCRGCSKAIDESDKMALEFQADEAGERWFCGPCWKLILQHNNLNYQAEDGRDLQRVFIRSEIGEKQFPEGGRKCL